MCVGFLAKRGIAVEAPGFNPADEGAFSLKGLQARAGAKAPSLFGLFFHGLKAVASTVASRSEAFCASDSSQSEELR